MMNDGAIGKDQITQRLDLLMSTTAKKDLKHNKTIELATHINYLISHFDNKGLNLFFQDKLDERRIWVVSLKTSPYSCFMLHGGSPTKQILYNN